MKQLFLLISLVLFSIMSFSQKEIDYEQSEKTDSIIFLEGEKLFETRDGLIYLKNEQTPCNGSYRFKIKKGKSNWEVVRTYKNGIVEGPFIDYLDGAKIFDGIYKNNEIDGKWNAWWFNGQKMTERGYKNGIKHGKEIEWDINGQKIFEKNYVNGKLDGKVIKCDKNGQIKYERTYKDGKRIRK